MTRLSRVLLAGLIVAASLATASCTPFSAGGAASSSSATATLVAPATPTVVATGPAEPTGSPPPAVGTETPVVVSFVYHHVKPGPDNFIAISPAAFEAHLKTMKRLGYVGVSAADLADYAANGTPLPERAVLITFDDGWANQYRYAVPLLEKYGYTATFFVYPKVLRGRSFMSKEQVKELARRGFDVQSHTWGHVPLMRKSGESASSLRKRTHDQCDKADEWIASATGKEPTVIAYPYGYYDTATADAVADCGYVLGLTVDEGANPLDAVASAPFLVKRFTVFKKDSLGDFEERLTSRPFAVTSFEPVAGARVGSGRITASLAPGEDASDIRYVVDSEDAATRESSGSGVRAFGTGIPGKQGFHYITLRGLGADGRLAYASWGVVRDR